jgi:hypothetical protein
VLLVTTMTGLCDSITTIWLCSKDKNVEGQHPVVVGAAAVHIGIRTPSLAQLLSARGASSALLSLSPCFLVCRSCSFCYYSFVVILAMQGIHKSIARCSGESGTANPTHSRKVTVRRQGCESDAATVDHDGIRT